MAVRLDRLLFRLHLSKQPQPNTITALRQRLDLLSPSLQHLMMQEQRKNDIDPHAAPTSFVQWAIRPPQSYAVYLICLFLVAGLSFYAGTFKPKNAVGLGPPAVSAPRN